MTETLKRNQDDRVMPPKWFENYSGGVTIREKYSTHKVPSCSKGSTFPFPISDAYTRESDVLNPQNPDLDIGEIKISKHGKEYEKIYQVENEVSQE